MTPSLANFLLSLLAGTLIVVIPAAVGLFFLSQSDKIQRGS
ncbi:photosystem II reaction center protein PsbX [Leptolyngbya sp. AN02str]